MATCINIKFLSIASYGLFELPVTVLVIAWLTPSVSVQYKRAEPCAMLVATPMISAARSAVTTKPIAASRD